jgi:hypothetical protein
MNLEERAVLWCAALKAKQNREHTLNELAKTEPHPTLLYIVIERVYILSPLGIALLMRRHGGAAAAKTLLERGASPNDLCEKLVKQGIVSVSGDAFHLACRYGVEKIFCLLLEYATPDNRIGLTPKYLSWVDAKSERSGACACLGWLWTQVQRDDLIEPVVQRLAAIPVEEWRTPERSDDTSRELLSKKKLKFEANGGLQKHKTSPPNRTRTPYKVVVCETASNYHY